MTWLLKYIKVAVLALFLLGGSISYARAENATEGDFYKNAGVLERLAQCESGNRWIVILDVNGKYSYGWWQFQLSTFRTFGEKYNIIQKGMSNEELRHWISFKSLQGRIADRMLSDGLWQHWINCLKTTYVR